MINIEGLEDLEKVLEEFDGELTAVYFDPEDPVSKTVSVQRLQIIGVD